MQPLPPRRRQALRPTCATPVRRRVGVGGRMAWRCCRLMLAAWLVGGAAAAAAMAATPVHFAVLGGVPANPAQVGAVHELLAAIANQPDVTFVLHDGNFKGPQEPCTDTLLQDRQALLNSSPLPLVMVPGAADWVDCQQPAAGSFDPLERLDRLRDLAFATADSMGALSLPLEHESDFTRYRNFHENTLWQQGAVLFVALNVVGHNNHYVDAGGRNGEFEDRTIANRFWLEHALRVAHLRHPIAVVIAIEGDPGLGIANHRGPFDWLDFRLSAKRDGYQEFKQDLLKFAQQYDGTVLLINQAHSGADHAAAAVPNLRLNPPRHKNGSPANRLWQLELNLAGDTQQWVDVEIAPAREASIRAYLRTVPAKAASLPSNASAVPAAPTSPASTLPPIALPVPVIVIPNGNDNDGAAPARPAGAE